MADQVCVGKITVAHGIKGYVKLLSYTDDPNTISSFKVFYSKDGKREFHIRIVSMQKNIAIAQIKGVTDRNEAEKLRHTELYVARDSLPEVQEGEYYWEDLAGLQVKLEDGSPYGKVISMHNYGAGDIIEIHCDKTGKDEMFSFNEQTIISVDIKGGELVLSLPEVVMVASEKTPRKPNAAQNDNEI